MYDWGGLSLFRPPLTRVQTSPLTMKQQFVRGIYRVHKGQVQQRPWRSEARVKSLPKGRGFCVIANWEKAPRAEERWAGLLKDPKMVCGLTAGWDWGQVFWTWFSVHLSGYQITWECPDRPTLGSWKIGQTLAWGFLDPKGIGLREGERELTWRILSPLGGGVNSVRWGV